MSFAWPWCFLLLPLPWLLRRLLPPAETGPALRVPSLPAAAPGEAAGSRPALAVATLAWLLLVAAAARPQAPAEDIRRTAGGRSLMVAFDLSASMGTRDLAFRGRTVDRLGAARAVAEEFLGRRQGDRVGLIVFGSRAYLHTPLTHDLEAVGHALAALEVGLAGRETALGDAVALAVKRLRDDPGGGRVLILFTDGAHTAGTLGPRRAAWLARREGVRIHAVGIGAGTASGLDEETLRALAGQTGGTYRRVTDAASMADFWRELEEIEPPVRDAAVPAPGRELYPWPLAAALLLAACLAWVRARGGRP